MHVGFFNKNLLILNALPNLLIAWYIMGNGRVHVHSHAGYSENKVHYVFKEMGCQAMKVSYEIYQCTKRNCMLKFVLLAFNNQPLACFKNRHLPIQHLKKPFSKSSKNLQVHSNGLFINQIGTWNTTRTTIVHRNRV